MNDYVAIPDPFLVSIGMSVARRKPLKTFVRISSKNSASLQHKAAYAARNAVVFSSLSLFCKEYQSFPIGQLVTFSFLVHIITTFHKFQSTQET